MNIPYINMDITYINMNIPEFITKSSYYAPLQKVLQRIIQQCQHLSPSIIVATTISIGTTYLIGKCIYRIWFHPLSCFPGPILSAISDLPFLYVNTMGGQGARYAVKLHAKYGPIVRVGPEYLIVDGSIGWPQIFANRKQEYPKRNLPAPDYEYSLFSASKERHRRLRRQLSHAFSDSALTEQEDLVMQYVDLLLSRLAEREESEINIVQWLNFTTFDIIGDLAFSSSYDCLANNGYHPWIRAIFDGIRGMTIIRFIIGFPFVLKIAMILARFTTIGKMNEIRELAGEKARTRLAIGEDFGNGRRDFAHYMLRKTRDGDDGMSHREILATSPTLVLAGSETTATALSGLFFYLKQVPNASERLAKEIREAFDSEDKITMQSTQKLEYLHACINEGLRVYPPVTESPPRKSLGDFIEGHYIPNETTLTIFQYATYHNPKHFLEPDSFIPERWLPDTHPLYDARFADDHHEVFKPFSFGNRDCIGKNLAQAELRLVLAKFFFRFDYELIAGQEDWHSKQKMYIVWDKGPLMLKITPRLPA